MIHVIVPVKELRNAKQRLGDMLDAAQRQALSLAMLDDMLATLTHTAGVLTTVVSRDDAVRERAMARGVAILTDRASNLNAALDQAVLCLRNDVMFLVLPADLPLLRSEDLRELAFAFTGRRSIVLVPAHDGGTNALLMHQDARLPFLFGPNSLTSHMTAARQRGLQARLVHLPRLARDIDDLDDLVWLARQPGESAAQRLARGYLAHRAR